MTAVNAWAAKAAKGPLVPFTYDAPALGPNDVEIDVTHCGICHSDIHVIDNNWHITDYPCVPGHEVAGRVAAIGDAVRHLAVGDRVGLGWQAGSCGACEWCVSARENLCPDSVATCVGHYGGYADRVFADARFAFKLPDALNSETAAPLLCGGITVYSPLRHYGITANMRVGVVGIGGLGHLAIRFARAFGCEVTAFSTSPAKEAEARDMGAHHFVPTHDAGALKSRRDSLDFILSTVHNALDWTAYIDALRPDGRLCLVGGPPEPVSFPSFALIGGQKSVSGSVIGGRARINEMLDFAARHGIGAICETMPLADVNAALTRVREGRVRYRMVLTR
ncbi:NAD(P)-dependent alcohol dehydrogenase [bacterium]|nr:NAD(P)-dependent alcohol dehydrogenase [bacterium]